MKNKSKLKYILLFEHFTFTPTDKSKEMYDLTSMNDIDLPDGRKIRIVRVDSDDRVLFRINNDRYLKWPLNRFKRYISGGGIWFEQPLIR